MINRKYSGDGEMWDKVASGDKDAANEMFLKHRGLATLFINKKNIGIRGYEREDLVSEMELALWKAVLKYDHRRGFSFSTYAFGAMGKHVSTLLSKTSKMPSLSKMYTEYDASYDEYPDIDIDSLSDGLPEDGRSVVEAILSGKNGVDIRRDLNMSHRKLLGIKEEIRKRIVNTATTNQNTLG